MILTLTGLLLKVWGVIDKTVKLKVPDMVGYALGRSYPASCILDWSYSGGSVRVGPIWIWECILLRWDWWIRFPSLLVLGPPKVSRGKQCSFGSCKFHLDWRGTPKLENVAQETSRYKHTSQTNKHLKLTFLSNIPTAFFIILQQQKPFHIQVAFVRVSYYKNRRKHEDNWPRAGRSLRPYFPDLLQAAIWRGKGYTQGTGTLVLAFLFRSFHYWADAGVQKGGLSGQSSRL